MREIVVSSDEVKEVYAHFGLAYYLSECLYQSVCHCVIRKQVGVPAGMTRPRMDELFSTAYEKTLGALVRQISADLPPNVKEKLDRAVDARNFLAHGFWFEQCHLLTSSSGIAKILDQLNEYQQLFESVNLSLESITTLQKALGISDEQVSASLDKVYAGAPMEPLHQQRKLKGQERLVDAWETNESGAKPLLFEADDGTFWQLCDVGLGWSFQKPNPETWIHQKQICAYLPATINPRPSGASSWSYELTLARGAVFWVKPHAKAKSFRWGIRSPSSKQ